MPEPDSYVQASVYYDLDELGRLELECEAVAFNITPDAIRVVDLSCIDSELGEVKPATLEVNTASVDAELAALVGQAALSFWNDGLNFFMDPARNAIFALRDANGELLVLSYADSVAQERAAPLSSADMSLPFFLGDDPPKQEAWNDPFGKISVRDVGCAERDGTRPGIVTEVPWVLEFDSDEGVQQFYDQSTGSVVVSAIRFDVTVARALDGVFRPAGDFGHELSELIVGDYLLVRSLEQ